MSTTSTVPAVIDTLLAVGADPASPVRVFESWPGPEGQRVMVFFGEVEWDDYVIPTIKAARKQRQENYTIEWTLWVIGEPGTSPANPKPARDVAFETLAYLENALADDPRIGLGNDVQHIQIKPGLGKPIKFEGGWAWEITGKFAVAARLL